MAGQITFVFSLTIKKIRVEKTPQKLKKMVLTFFKGSAILKKAIGGKGNLEQGE